MIKEIEIKETKSYASDKSYEVSTDILISGVGITFSELLRAMIEMKNSDLDGAYISVKEVVNSSTYSSTINGL